MLKSFVSMLIVPLCLAADWSAWLQQGADQVAQDFGYESFDAAKAHARHEANQLTEEMGWALESPKGNDPYLAGYGAVPPRGNDFVTNNPYEKMRGCAPNKNEGRHMCWTTASVFDEHSWCWVDTDCRSHEDCRTIFAWKPCYGEKVRKGTDKEEYNRYAFASRLSKDGL